jgi:hypothetical protein
MDVFCNGNRLQSARTPLFSSQSLADSRFSRRRHLRGGDSIDEETKFKVMFLSYSEIDK